MKYPTSLKANLKIQFSNACIFVLLLPFTTFFDDLVNCEYFATSYGADDIVNCHYFAISYGADEVFCHRLLQYNVLLML